jgi:hypothetical protein
MEVFTLGSIGNDQLTRLSQSQASNSGGINGKEESN